MKIRDVLEKENLKTFKDIMKYNDLSIEDVKEHYELLINLPIIVKSIVPIHKYYMDKLKKLINKESERYRNLLFNRRRAIIVYVPNDNLWHIYYYIPIAGTYMRTTKHSNPYNIEESKGVNFMEFKPTEELGLYTIYNNAYVKTSSILEYMKEYMSE